ncbi:MAG: N-acetyltransferase, partial [Prochlorococcaceae cyanobacterium MAG_34]|nr:N-acetyltransferase [Prochlorococcaceae cyanobacterium MAG_34]
SAPPQALAALERYGFAVDPGGIRAMGLKLAS